MEYSAPHVFSGCSEIPSHHKAEFSGKKPLMDFAALRHPFVQFAAVLILAFGLAAPGIAHAQDKLAQDGNADVIAPIIPPGGLMGPRRDTQPSVPHNPLLLSALLSATDLRPIGSGLKWRVFDEATETDGSHRLVAESARRPRRFLCRTAIISCIVPWDSRA